MLKRVFRRSSPPPPLLGDASDLSWIERASPDEIQFASHVMWEQALVVAQRVRGAIQSARPVSEAAEASFYRVEQELHRISHADQEIQAGVGPFPAMRVITTAWERMCLEGRKWQHGVYNDTPDSLSQLEGRLLS
jgi:hypothetical protein